MKILSWILSMICCCSTSNIDYSNQITKIKLGDSIQNTLSSFKHSYIGFPFQTIVLNEKGNCVIIISNNSITITGIAVFSPNKNLLYSNGISPIDSTDITTFIGKTVESIKLQYGNIHFDNGSGIRVPSYITKNAEIVYFLVNPSPNPDNEVIKDIIVEDIVDKYFPV